MAIEIKSETEVVRCIRVVTASNNGSRGILVNDGRFESGTGSSLTASGNATGVRITVGANARLYGSVTANNNSSWGLSIEHASNVDLIGNLTATGNGSNSSNGSIVVAANSGLVLRGSTNNVTKAAAAAYGLRVLLMGRVQRGNCACTPIQATSGSVVDPAP